MNYQCLFGLLFTVFGPGDGVNILGVFASPSYSHHIFFQSIYKELALRGHNVTVITPSVLNDKALQNLREIDIHQVLDLSKRNNINKLFSKDKSVFNIVSIYQAFTGGAIQIAFDDVKVKKILNSSEKFDILILQVIHPLIFSIAAKYRVPVIGKYFF